MKFRQLCFLFVLGSLILCSHMALAASNVLVIHSYHPSHTWERFLREGIDSSFKEFPSARVYHEYLDSKRFPQKEYQQQFLQYLAAKYQKTPPQIILVSDDAALQAFRAHRTELFPNPPVVFMGINQVSQELIDDPNFTGVFENRDLATTVREIMEFTKQDELIVITDTSKPGLDNLKKIEPLLASDKLHSKIHVIKDLHKDMVYSLHDQYSQSTPILIIGQLIDSSKNNALIGWLEGCKHISSILKNPIFTIGIVTVGNGATGADNLFAKDHSSQAAKLAIKILTGTPVDQIEPISVADSQWIFDWKRLKFHGIPQKDLPEGSRFINYDESFIDRHITLMLVALASLIGICLGFWVGRSRQRKKDLG